MRYQNALTLNREGVFLFPLHVCSIQPEENVSKFKSHPKLALSRTRQNQNTLYN